MSPARPRTHAPLPHRPAAVDTAEERPTFACDVEACLSGAFAAPAGTVPDRADAARSFSAEPRFCR
jgi:hypothetical protein